MNSPKVKTQNTRTRIKNLSTVLAMLLALVTLFQASADKKPAEENRVISTMEAEAIAEIQAFFLEDEEVDLEEVIISELEEQSAEGVKVFDNNGKLLASGSPESDESLRNLVNKADYLSRFADTKYYRIAE